MEETAQQLGEVLPIQEDGSSSQSSGDELANKKYLKTRDYVFFSLAQFASSAVTGLVQGYLLFFYTVCVSIPASAVGTMFLVSKIFDGLNDPIMGVIVDRTRTKWGKMRPYLFGAAVPWGILTIVMFMPSIYSSMGTNAAKIAFMWVTYLLYSVLGTAVGVPLNGLPAVASPNTDERAKIISISRILGSVGEQSALVLLTLFLLITSDNYTNSYMLMAIIIGVLGPVFMVLGAKFVKERLEPTERTPNVLEGFKYLFRNKQFLLLICSNLLTFFRNFVSAMIIYVVSYIYAKGSLQILFSLPGAVASMIGMMIAPKLRKKMDSKRLFIFATIWHSAALALIFFIYILGGTAWWLVAALMFIAMIPVGILNVIPHLMATDTLDYWEDKTGDRCEGITFSLMSLRSKVSSGLKDYTMSYLLVFFGFSQALPFLSDHTPVQSDFTKLGLFSIYTIIPAVLNLISIVPILFYKLSGKKMAEIQGRLAVKRLEDAKRLEGIIDAEVKGEKDIYSVVAVKEYEEELAKSEITAQQVESESNSQKEGE
ncbi:MAG: glycoside-pentoside-hexuronide (GPH):cation symporter [Clostridia bacterium]|nr:glycoside-pentoside-hexuronide (GPH):cation symporter [Clostridia bacterium]MDE7329247.1 glycoside-pentoside-hexuronide (GPH):cation symporter [Clostridia bacterium]